MGRLIVEADGGSRGNPGVAGYGALVRDAATGRVLAERAEPLGKASNNVAEYSGLIAGLEAARDIDPAADIDVRMDSKLVVEQMAGRWKIKHEDMQRLAAQARTLVAERTARGGRVGYTWIPRAQNSAADKLSNVAMDGRRVDRRHLEDGGEEGDTEDADRADASAGLRSPAPAEGPEFAEVSQGPEGPEGREVAQGPEDPQGPDVAQGPEGPEPVDAVCEPPPARARARTRPAAPDLGAPVRVVLVRHGATEATRAGLLDGRGGSDGVLTAEGRRQAEAAATALRPLLPAAGARVVTSSLARARQTGAVIAAGLGGLPETDPAWDEQHFGDWEGRTVAEVCADDAPAYARLRNDPYYARPGGESREALHSRVLKAYRALTDSAQADGRLVVVVSHRAAILAVLEEELGLASPWSLTLSPASLTCLRRWADGGCAVDVVNDTAHLRPAR